MKKQETIDALTALEKALKDLRKTINGYNGPQIKQKILKENVQQLAGQWFQIENKLVDFGISKETLAKYHSLFNELLQMGFKDTRKGRYYSTLSDLQSSFKNDLVIPAYKHAGEISKVGQLDAIFDILTEEEKDLMKEAIDCARSGYLRASIVLAWSTAVHRMHKIAEKMGFDTFNKKSEEMKKITEGRYKRFTKSYNIQTFAELQATVFDNDLLWVLEYCGYIDNTQHDRLSTCFVMRNNCAHPSKALISEENLLSFYSDIKTIILDNEKFKL